MHLQDRDRDMGQATSPPASAPPQTGDREDAGGDPLSRFSQWLRQAVADRQIDPDAATAIGQAIDSARQAVETEFSQPHDTVRLLGQDNIRRYRAAGGGAAGGVTLRVGPDDSLRDALRSLAAAMAVQARITLSIDPDVRPDVAALLESSADAVPGLIDPVEESDPQLADRIGRQDVTRLRLLQPAPTEPAPGHRLVAAACAEAFVTRIDQPVVGEGRIECLRYLDEQSISENYHRYGNLGRRVGEQRREVL
jgi:RHH-type proline utilization regulon transcriptional repressor/proline dehydrogenase/delta 1-pyrroline-5-carboxylate dehydrogenase